MKSYMKINRVWFEDHLDAARRLKREFFKIKDEDSGNLEWYCFYYGQVKIMEAIKNQSI